MKAFIGIFVVLLVISGIFHWRGNRDMNVVGVARSSVSAKIDLTDKLNPQILPDVLNQVFASITVSENPEKEAFQKEVVQKFSQAIMEDPEINYRVDLNEDGTIDPILVVPESVEGKAAVYSLRVADPGAYPKDPGNDADWQEIAGKQSIELVEVAVTTEKSNKKVAISSTPNPHVYENQGGNTHYTQSYHSRSFSWIEAYFAYSLFSSILFGPYGWGMGPFYGGYYGGYQPYPTHYRSRPVNATRYGNAPRTGTALKTAGGTPVTGSRSQMRKGMPSSLKQIKSQRAMQVRKQTYSRKGGGFGQRSVKQSAGSRSRFGGFGRQRSSAFGGGGPRGWGK